MFLLLNLSIKDDIQLSLFDNKKIINKNYKGLNKELLECVDDLLKINNLNPKKIKGVMVVVGAGGFTNTRIAVVVGNTLAYTLQIPILAIQENQTKKIQDLIPELLDQLIGQYITASYSGKPNITKSKKNYFRATV